RCLVVAPSHLTVQWLAELFHKFNLLFTLMDPDRARDDREAAEASEAAPEEEGATPWARHPLVITSLEWLSRSKSEADDAAEAGWDLVVFDEAHHLRGARAYEVAQALAKRTWGLLLLTHLAESYGLSARRLRNRRAVVGGFTRRTLRRVEVQPSAAERDLESDVREAMAEARLPSGAVLAALLRRMGSSPPALAAGLE